MIVLGHDQHHDRESIASFFRQFADRLARGEPVAVDVDQHVAVKVPDEQDMAVTVDHVNGIVSIDIERLC